MFRDAITELFETELQGRFTSRARSGMMSVLNYVGGGPGGGVGGVNGGQAMEVWFTGVIKLPLLGESNLMQIYGNFEGFHL